MTETEYTDTQGRRWRRVSSGGGGHTVFAPPSAGTIPPDVVAWLRSQQPEGARGYLSQADDPDALPDVRIRRIAEQLAGMINAGELKKPSDATLATLAMLPMVMLDIAGDVGVLVKEAGA